MMRRLISITALCLLLSGCRHKPPPLVAVALPVPIAPVVEEPAPTPKTVPPVQAVPDSAVPLPNVALPKKAKKVHKKPVPVVTPAAPVQVASTGAPVPAADVVGALSTGGEDAATHQKTADLLTALEKRLNALPTAVLEKQREQITRIRYFWDQAHMALFAGDADGAMTLATKAKVLLDDVTK